VRKEDAYQLSLPLEELEVVERDGDEREENFVYDEWHWPFPQKRGEVNDLIIEEHRAERKRKQRSRRKKRR